MTVEVLPVSTKAEREAFLRLPWRLYKDFPGWVPNLLLLQRDVINEKKNPFFEHGEAQLFLARREGEYVGRISAQIDRDHNAQHDERTGFFGFFESIDDGEVAKALLETAEAWLRERWMNVVRGPFSFSVNEEAGLQVEGFDEMAMIQMPQHLPYYGGLVEGAGYGKAMDLLAYRWNITEPPARMMEAVEATRKAPGLKLRTIRVHGIPDPLRKEVDLLLDIYNDAWQDNWGYVRVTASEARKLADDLRLIADRSIVVIAEVDGEPAGVVVGIPNLYEAIRDFNGHIDPIKAVKLVWRLKIRGTETGRILLFGVKRKFQRRRALFGLPFVLLHELYLGSQKGRYKWCEESWILENNKRLNALMPNWDAYVYKRYRVYEKAL
ncbi:MAG TPA: N-acetyltransferase [Dehalococcoidia bacterium]|nr:N-acetyltransferase [Dehalococcoidia bacterium]